LNLQAYKLAQPGTVYILITRTEKQPITSQNNQVRGKNDKSGILWRYTGIALYDERVHGKNERNIKQPRNVVTKMC